MYRDDRGALYHPHVGRTFALGTRSVAGYDPPRWLFNRILYAEKEGLFPILQQARWPERHDCALLTSKGFATRAARDVLRLVGDTGLPVTFYCIHDADGPGTVIFENLARSLRPAGVEVVNLGLDPAEARAMGLRVEPVQPRKNDTAVPTGSYLPAADREWLQRNRVELNMMTTPQFVAWLDRKLAEHGGGKVVPPDDVVRDRLEADARAEAERWITEEVLRQADVAGRVAAYLAARRGLLDAVTDAVTQALPEVLTADPGRHWSDVVREAAAAAVTDDV